MRLSVLPFSLRIFFCSALLLFLAACGSGSDDDDEDRLRSAQSGVFVDSAVNGLAYSTVTRSGVTGSGGTAGAGRFNYLDGESVTFRLDCLRLGSATGRAVISPRTLRSGAAATNMARLLLSLDQDGDTTNGIDVGHVDLPADLCDLDFANFPEADVEAFIQGLIDNGNIPGNQDPSAGDNALVSPPYAEAHLNCSLNGGTYFNGCGTQNPTLSIANASILEGDAGTSALVFTVSLSAASNQAVNVQYATAPANPVSAATDTDYQAASGTVTFPANTTSQQITVQIVGDTVSESTETFLVNLSNPSNATIADGQAVGTINDNDAPPEAPRLVINDVTLAEGNSDTTAFNFTVTLQNPGAGSVTVTAATAVDPVPPANHDAATSGTDFAPKSQQLTLSAAATTATFTVSVNGDTVVENDETFLVKLSNATGATIQDDTGLGAISNDDQAPPTPTLAIQGVELNEGNSGTTNFVFNVTLSPNASAVSVAYETADGTAAAGATGDYTATSGTLTFPVSATQQTQTITVAVRGDIDNEPNESFTVNLDTTTGTTNPDQVSATGTITNDDAPAGPAVSIGDVSAAEGNVGTTQFSFPVTLLPASAQAVTVSYATASGSATSGQDFVAETGEVTIPAGETSGTITIDVNGDLFQENNETFSVTISSPVNATIGDGSATGTITNDDGLAQPLLRAGASKKEITPTQAHIDGIPEPRIDGTTHLQKFNLGGFGVDPVQNVPDDPAGAIPQIGEALTEAASQRVFSGSRGDEHTHVRAMVLEQADGTRVAFVMIDAVGAGNIVQKNLKAEIIAANKSCGAGGNEACFLPENILFGQTHSHAGADLQGLWGGVPQDWINNADYGLYTQAAAAVGEAIENLRPARITLQQGQNLNFNSHRRQNLNGDDEADGTLTLLKATGDDATPIGSLLQYNAHPTAINEDPRIPHADYIQGALDWLESPENGEGGVALYYNGPIADASGSSSRAGCIAAPGDGDYGNVRCRGEGIADAAQNFRPRELAPTLAARHEEVILPITNPGFVALGLAGTFNRYYDFSELPAEQIPGIGPLVAEQMVNLPQLTPIARTLVSRITIGGAQSGLEVVTIPGEATNTFGQYIRGLAATDMMLLGLTQNSFGYIIPEEEFNYLNPGHLDGDNENSAFDVPFTSYEEFVSLGPLTAPLLRLEGYNPLFDIAQDDARNLPPYIRACMDDPTADACILSVIGRRLEYIQSTNEKACLDSGVPDEFCGLINPETPLADPCRDAGLPEDLCDAFGGGGGGTPADPLLAAVDDVLDAIAEGCHDGLDGTPLAAVCAVPDTLAGLLDGGVPGTTDVALVPEALKAQLQGCDMLDPAHCLFPFPNDHFTVPASAGSPQDADSGGTGKRINFSPLAMPRNVAGKPIDPTEWNRNDGFSPGQMIVTYVPGLAANADGTIPGAPTIRDAGASLDLDSPVLVLDAETGEPHPVWAEIDLNAGMLLYVPGGELGRDDAVVPNPKPKQAALIIRPAVNFKEGHRYVVVLRNLKNEAEETIPAEAAFTVCRDGLDTALPPLQQRCTALEENVFSVIDDGLRDENLYLAWDFTVASTNNTIGRLRHMRDDAFVNYLGQVEDDDGVIENLGRAPAFEITEVNDYPETHGQLVREIKGTFTVPSYVVPADPSPLDGQAEFRRRLNGLPPEVQAQIESGPLFAPIEASLPPNRLFYLPDATSAAACDPAQPEASLQGRCLEQARFGDGLPDQSGEMTTTFTCRVAKSTLSNKSFAEATAVDLKPARPSLYGHGLLGDHGEINQDQLRRFGNDHNMMFCATDWFGFASGDLPNVLSQTLDVSNFPLLPDGTQQGILNQMFLARLMRHPQGFAGNANFQVAGQPVFDRREVFYDGNSQGGITGGVVVAASKDIKRGSLGVLGMNYSTLLTRSVDFDIFSVPLYASYPDDLDRDLIFSLMQMLWDRSENNGYAHHLRDNAAFKGPNKEVLMHPAFGDHQVTMWSADVMARTVGATVDRSEISSDRRAPVGFNNPELPGFETTDYLNPDHATGSGLMYWDEPWPASDGDNCAGKSTPPPPVGNVPPRLGNDPHECPRRQVAGRCQKSHFLHSVSRLIDVSSVTNPADCPAVPEPVGTPLDGGSASSDVFLCAPDIIPGIGGECIEVSALPLIGPLLSPPLNGVDGVTEALADGCHGNAGPLAPACVITDSVAQLIQQGTDTAPPVGNNNASCATGSNLARKGHYQVTIPSESGEVISFEVFEPTNGGGISCVADGDSFVGEPGAHPLILQGHGFGGSRSKGDGSFSEYRSLGYAVISIDQRGFGQSTGTVRTMDPDFEGKDLVRILDWAEENLDYLTYRDEQTGQFVARPAGGESEAGGENLVTGAIGGSYGGGFQFLLHNVDEKDRLDALAPDITWHDLRYSLNPGDTLKSAFGLLLSVGGESGSYRPGLEAREDPTHRGIDPFVKEVLARAIVTGEFPREALEWFRYHSPTYWCDLRNEPTQPYAFAQWAPLDPNTMLGTLAGGTPGSNRRDDQPPVDILISQGFRDNLFNFNEAWWNYQCARVRGGDDADVRLITHQSGHILNLGGLTGQPVPPGTPLDVQSPGTTNNCGAVTRGTATVQWFNEKLRNGSASALLAPTDENKLCLSLSDNDAIFVPEEHLLAPMADSFADLLDAPASVEYHQIGGVGAASVPQGVLALTLHNAGQLSPSVVPLLSVGDANGLIVAGIPQGTFTVRTPAGVNDAACVAAPSQLPSLRTGCDSIIYVGLGKKISGSSAWVTIDDQVTPVRGLGEHAIEMVGVGERLAQGDQLALLIYGFHPQYVASYSRDASIPVVNVEADLQLPLYGVVAGGAPDFFNPAGASVNGIATGTGCTDPSYTGVDAECIATGTATNVVRQLCDYQWLPGVCEQFPHEDPGYQPNGGGAFAAAATYDDSNANGPLQLMTGAVHEHSGYSDGDPAMIPRDYFRAGRTGVNEPGLGVALDFMWSSEHSDNEKLAITTSAACIPFGADVFENPGQIAEADPATLTTRMLACNHMAESHHHFKWLATLQQAMAESTYGTDPVNGFTGIRGFEWTNDYYNHMNVYFSTNVVNVKVDGSYLSMDVMWNWLRRPVAEGGGADALLTFNHPGGDPALTPFDGSQPHNELLAVTRGGSNWNDLAYVADVDERVAGIEVNGGDDIEWYVKALTKGWHIGPLTNEDEHGRNWSSNDQGKTLVLTRGRSPQDYYYAFQNHRTVAIRADLVSGAQSAAARVPELHYWADGASLQEGVPLGSAIRTAGPHVLHIDFAGLPAGYKVALLSNRTNGQAAPEQLGVVDGAGAFSAVRGVTAPTVGEDWYFVAVCPASAAVCGSDQNYSAVTAPIWFGPGLTPRAPIDLCLGDACVSDIPVVGPLLLTALNELDNTLDTLAGSCHSNAGALEDACVVPDTLAGLIDPDGAGGAGTPSDVALVPEVAKTLLMGCDFLDPANCLYPFPNDYFTAPAAEGSPQDADNGGTGRRVNISPLATPRNSAGKPVDPTEWNRNDGFSPGALITTYVPDLSLERTYGLPSHEIGLANLALSQDKSAPILVLEVPEDDGDELQRHLVWAEIDQNANQLTIVGAPNVGTQEVPGVTNARGHVRRPNGDGKAALLIRPAKNFSEGKRYVVVLRDLKDAAGNPIAAQAGFRACLEGESQLPPVQQRCAQLEDNVFPVLAAANVELDEVYLAWDFTVQSTNNAIGRLRHMRDDAFASLSSEPADEDCTQLTDANAATCAAPAIEIVNVQENPQGGIRRRIEGVLTVPSYLVPFEPAPGDDAPASGAVHRLCDNASELEGDCRGDFRDLVDLAQGATAPNRLFYSPADGAPAPDPNNPADPTGLRFGDGLPDSTGSMQARFLCQIPAQATPDTPARASLYGHGQLDRGVAITYEGVPDQAREHNYMFCAVDWFGFRTGDAVNVLSTLVDLSNFQVVPDASQQGMLNMMFLARAMQHPRGLGALAPFQDAESGRPLFDRGEIFYDGNSQGGIFGGVVLAASKDVNRGVLGALGMNYSTLLTRSANFDEYAGVLYNSYTDPLDRQLLFSMIQMLWDRSENDGYAAHLHYNSAFGGPSNAVMLAPAFGDPQVSMWTADNMARTIGDVPYDMQQTLHVESLGTEAPGPNGRRHPDVAPYYRLPAMDYSSEAVNGSVLQVWDNNQLKGKYAFVPPITNTPPYATKEDDRDPHDTSQRTVDGRCVHAHFMRTGGQVIDAMPLVYGSATCPPIPPATPTVAPGTAAGPQDLPGKLGAALDRFVEAVTLALGHLAEGEVIAALDALIGGTTQLVADAGQAVLVEVGTVVGINLPTPGTNPDPELPAPEALMAGVAKLPIQVPVGVPLGGYLRPSAGGEYIGDDPVGELTDNVPAMADGCDPTQPESCPPLVPLPDELRKAHSPYATYSPPSRGYYDSLIAKAVVLYDGNDYVVLVKTDFIGMLDEVVQDVKAEVKDRTDIDLGDGLIMSATHSHDGPGALANHSTRYFWLAMDLYQHDVYRRLVTQLADVVVLALDDMKPARIGHGNGLESPETGNGNGINGYRRGRLASYADNDQPGCAFVAPGDCPPGIDDANELRKRIGVLRVDDATTGAPMAVVINFADHGIAFDVENQYFSGDVLGSIEREVEQSYPAPAAGSPTIAMLVQNTGGDVTPKNVEYSIRGIEMLGKRMAPQVRAVADVIGNFQSAPDLRAVSQRVILNRERLGYEEDEYPYPWGAAQCGNDIAVPFADIGVNDVPGYGDTGLPTKHLYCIPATPPDAADLADNGVAENGAFVPGDTILTAAKIGGITLLVQPGEPLTEYGVRALEMAQAEGFAPADTFVWGYAADHIGYILPPVKEDWAQFGGAESTTTFWGWKQGQRFIDGHRELLAALRDGKAPPAHEFQVDYSKYRQMYDATPAAVPTPSLLPGTAVSQPDDIRRFQATRFVFEGGDPVLDLPSVTMVHADGTPVRRANGEILDTFFEMHLKYRLVTGRHLWTVEFEAPKDWAAGTYRFVVSGKANQGTDVDYDLESADFTVSPATNLQAQNLACEAGVCSVHLKYTPVPANYRVVDPNVDPRQAAPVRGGTVTFSNGTTSVVANDPDNDGHYTASIGGSSFTASGVDVFGNTTPGAGPGPEPEPEGFPLCEPFTGEDFCLDDIPVIGPPAQDAVDLVYNTVIGDGLPDRCVGSNCLSGLPLVGGLFNPGDLPVPVNTSCASAGGVNPPGGRNYQVKLRTHDEQILSFQVLEPTQFDCASVAGGAHPLILHGPGYGGSRSTSGFTNYRDAGYTVISWDPRGFGDTTGTVRVMDPEFEGQYLVQILDWAEDNLDYLAYRDQAGTFVERPFLGSSTDGDNLVVGAIGGSYGGGYQLLLARVDEKKRLDAIQPDITWHDLRYSLNPGDTIKTLWDVALAGAGEATGEASGGGPVEDGQDPFIKETLARGASTNEWPRQSLDWFRYRSMSHWCEAAGLPHMPYPAYGEDAVPMVDATDSDNVPDRQLFSGRPGFGDFLVEPDDAATHFAGLSVLLTQGMPDTLFTFNDAWWNAQCLMAAGADVSLTTHLGGHTLPYAQAPGSVPATATGGAGCSNNSLAWFNDKLKGIGSADVGSVCFALADDDTVTIPEGAVLAPQPEFNLGGGESGFFTPRAIMTPTPVTNGAAAASTAAGVLPVVAPLGIVQQRGVLAGLPFLDVTVATPAGANEAAQDCGDPAVPTVRAGCDSIIFAGLGIRRAAAPTPNFELIDDQLQPLRGLGQHRVDMVGVAERLQPGDQLALLLFGQHAQFFGSYSRDATIPAVNVEGIVKLPIYFAHANGEPAHGVDASGVLGNGGGLTTPDAPGVLQDAVNTANPWYPRDFLSISHRGGAEEYPENTLFAYAESLKVGADMIEADVYQTADGELVVIHDATVNRTTNGTGAVNTMTLAQIKALDAAYCFRPGGSNCSAAGLFPYRGMALDGGPTPPVGYTRNDFRIPTLRELLARFPDTLINLELKPDERGAGSYEGKMAALLKEFGRTDDVIVASFLDTASATFKMQAPEVSTSVPTAQVALAVATAQGPANGITVGHEAFQVPVEFNGVPVTDQEFVDDAHARGLAVHVWTIDNPEVMVELLCMGVDGIMTDRPSVLRDVLADFDPDTDCGGAAAIVADYGSGILGALAQFMAQLNDVVFTLVGGDPQGAGEQLVAAVTEFGQNLAAVPGNADPARPGTTVVGLADEPLYQDDDGAPAGAVVQAASANRDVEPVILTGERVASWSVPAAQGAPYPYPSGVGGDGEDLSKGIDEGTGGATPGGPLYTRDAHNGEIVYPQGDAPTGMPVDQIAAWRWDAEDEEFVEIPVQVDEKYPYFLANAQSGFSFYSGTDEELTYAWDKEHWDPLDSADGCSAVFPDGQPDPVAGLDHDDEIVFMASDAGAMAPPDQSPPGRNAQMVRLADPLNPAAQRVVYLTQQPGGSSFDGPEYVNFTRNPNADAWIDRTFFADNDPEKIGTSNTGYGPNLSGDVCHPTLGKKPSNDRFPRDGTVVTTDSYRWEASGRWMIRKLQVAKPDQPGVYGADLVDRWKGRAFQQSPDSTISVVGFEDEQVNWEANSALLGERCGPVRCIREVWGADSGTNVTKTETFYRDAITYRYHVRVHPIPPDGLYTSWDYNRPAMLPTEAERSAGVAAGRYFTMLRPQGVPIDGVNDDVGQIDAFTPINGECPHLEDGTSPPAGNGRCPAFFDAADPTFNLTLAFNNWEQISGKGDLGSLVYIFENKGATSYGNPAVVPYYRDDACLDDGTGDDPVVRPYPGERSDDSRVVAGYVAANGGKPYAELACHEKQGAHAQHGVHYFVTHDTDNAFAEGKPITEIDGQQWQFMVPTATPANVGDFYANVVRAPLQPVVVPLPPDTAGERQGGMAGLFEELAVDFQNYIAELASGDIEGAVAALQIAYVNLAENVNGVIFDSPDGSAGGTVLAAAQSPSGIVSNLGDFITGAFTPDTPTMRAGVGVIDMTPDVGYGTGQHGGDGTERFDGLAGGEMDPYLTHKKLGPSYGVQSRLTARAIVVEGSNGKRVALLKTDNYLAQDALLRRVAQILAAGDSGIGYDQILHHVTHDHNAAYNSTPAAGVWAFEDAFDARFFEFQARKMAEAVELAAANLKPARMGAMEIRHTIFKGNVTGPSTADNGTPAGYPREYGDHGLVVMRFDDMTNPADPIPLAAWINWGEHPESLRGGVGLHSADFLAPLERFVERDIGAPLVFSQGDVGSAEREGNSGQCLADTGSVIGVMSDAACIAAGGTHRSWNRRHFHQVERNVRFLADDVKRAWDAIALIPANSTEPRKVPFATTLDVGYLSGWVPGPLSHPYPSVGNCRSEPTVEANPGVPAAGLPDCERAQGSNDRNQMIAETWREHGLPVPEHYDGPSLGTVEENARLKLQAIRIGEVLLASCACESQVDLILNLESRLDPQTGNNFDGFDWACLIPAVRVGEPAEYTAACNLQASYYDPAQFPYDLAPNPGVNNLLPAAIAHMRAQVHNPADGWDAPEYLPFANGEPGDITQIKGNFTREEVQDLGVSGGYRLPVGIGHAGDYNGYTVSYREYMRGDHYRKALTAYGPHTADYMATRLVRMGAALKGGKPFLPEAHDAGARADEARMQAGSLALGLASSGAYDAWLTALPADPGPAAALAQPGNITHFAAATFRWRGGNTQVDNPVARVEKLCTAGDIASTGTDLGSLWLKKTCGAAGAGNWAVFADGSGEVQTRAHLPEGVPGALETYGGQFEWLWTANFEAYEALPARLGSTPLGIYRFVVSGCINDEEGRGTGCPGDASRYELTSNAFQVTGGGIPRRGYAGELGAFPFIQNGPPTGICDTCSFRPWRTH